MTGLETLKENTSHLNQLVYKNIVYFRLNAQVFVNSFHVWMKGSKGIPEGSKVVDVSYDLPTGDILIKIEHPSFAAIANGDKIPEIFPAYVCKMPQDPCFQTNSQTTNV